MAGIRERLLALSRQPGMTICPMLVGLDMSIEDAMTQARSRLRDIEEWALDMSPRRLLPIDERSRLRDIDEWGLSAEDAGKLQRFDYLVGGWNIDEIYLLRPRSPVPDPEPSITIGRSRHCDLCIPDEWISKVHAAVIRDGDPREPDVRDHYYITDMESHHGVLINGEPVPAGKMRHLDPNDILTLGLTTLLFVDAYMQYLLVRGA
jgi:pSer/pThr/pTyr-binding forkhead associated (FHA) protein